MDIVNPKDNFNDVTKSSVFSDSNILQTAFSPDSHPSIKFSCADKLLWLFADQILAEDELSIAYPSINCQGGLTLFLAYLTLCLQTDNPGGVFKPVLVYPGTTEIREYYTALTIRIGDLLEGLSKIRVIAYKRGGSPKVYDWEKKLLKRIREGKRKLSDRYPLHDFFPAAVLDGDSIPKLIGGRHGFGRGDNTIPPLLFVSNIQHVNENETYRAAYLMHDSLTTHAERRRLNKNLKRITASTVIHLFESPFSPNFRKLAKKGIKSWRIHPTDFPEDGEIFLEDDNILEIMEIEPRVHILPPPIRKEDQKILYENFEHLRKSAVTDTSVSDVYRRLYNLYRFILTLPVPVEDYNAIVGEFGYSTVEERLEDIKENVGDLGATDYAFFNDALQKIMSMEDRLKDDPVRSRGIFTEVQNAINNRLKVGIVVTNEIFGSAIERFLSRKLELDTMFLSTQGIQVIHLKSLRSLKPEEKFDLLIFPSYRGGNTLRWVISGKSKEVVIIATDNERRAMLRDFREGTECSNTWSPIRNEPPMPIEDNPEKNLLKAISDVDLDIPSIPLDDEIFVQGLLEHIPSKIYENVRQLSPSNCIKVIFRQHYAYLPIEGAVTVVDKKDTKEKAVKDLKTSDNVLFINHSQSQTIYDVMLDEIKRSANFEPYVVVIQHWHRRLKSWFIDSGLTYTDLHSVLAEKGSKVVGATVASWIRGNTMAPLDPKNLARIISLVGIDDQNGHLCMAINDAAVRLRKVYRVYARAVNSFLLKAAGDSRPEIEDLLQKYNLDIGAIRDSVTQEEIVTIIPEIITISTSAAGRLYEN